MTQQIVVIGGGIGGLCTAIALRQMGLEVTVYEKAATVGQVGAGLTLWPNALRVLRRLNLADAIIQAGAQIKKFQLRTASGHTLSSSHPGQLAQQLGEPAVAIHRAELHRILLAALPQDVVRLGAACTGFTQSEQQITVTFADGHSVQADLLIGADGIHSIIRPQIMPQAKPRYAGYTAWRGVVATEQSFTLGQTFESWGQGARFGAVPLSERLIYWFATANRPIGQTQSTTEQKTWLQQHFQGWHHPIGYLLETTPAEAILHHDIYDLQPFTPWSQGRATLLGDAAHATTPNMGQGACMAIESAFALASCIKENREIAAALRTYEARRQPRTAYVTRQSWQIGRVGQLKNRWGCYLRDLLMGFAPDALLQRRLSHVTNYMP